MQIFLNLIRWKNLILIALVQILIKYALFEPFDVTITLNGLGFALLILSTLCLAAAGNIINDIYDIENGKKVKYYDYKSKPNTFKSNKGNRRLTDNYDTNVYDYKKIKTNLTQILPSFGANPDDGFKIGAAFTKTNYHFERNPFSSQHSIKTEYFFATNGFDLNYGGEFANVFQNINFAIDANYNSPNYATNFFGFGNETPNFEADEDDGIDVGFNYNRVKIREASFSPALLYRGRLGAIFKFGLSFESYEIQETEGRFINTFIGDNTAVSNEFIGAEVQYHYDNKDDDVFPTLGMETTVTLGYKSNLDSDMGFGYIIPELGLDHKLVANGQLVLATKLKAHINFDDGFEFYQAANIGANSGLRGYRNERFTGKNSFVQSTDLRLNLRRLKTGLLPLNIGIYGGVDYGRVWVDGEDSDKWNNSIGGGIFANIAKMATLNLSAFSSDDGLRLAFRLGFGF